jgi:hypothetical protein
MSTTSGGGGWAEATATQQKQIASKKEMYSFMTEFPGVCANSEFIARARR